MGVQDGTANGAASVGRGFPEGAGNQALGKLDCGKVTLN